MRVAFGEWYTSVVLHACHITEFVCDVFFLIDLLLQCGLAYDGPDGKLVTNRLEILQHYTKSWMLIDALGSFPFDWCVDGGFPPAALLGGGVDEAGEGSELSRLARAARLTRLSRLLKLLRLLRLFRLTRISYMHSRSTDYSEGLMAFFSSFLTILRYVLAFGLLAHVLACIEFFAARELWPHGWIDEWPYDRLDGDELDDGRTWVFAPYLLPTYGAALRLDADDPDTPRRRWLELAQLYSAAIFHAVGQLVGVHEGLSPPRTVPEFWLTTIVMMVGTSIYAAFLGVIAASLQERYTTRRAYRTTMTQVAQFVRHRNVPQELGRKLLLYFNACNPHEHEVHDGEILERLSPMLRKELRAHLARAAIDVLRHAAPARHRGFGAHLTFPCIVGCVCPRAPGCAANLR